FGGLFEGRAHEFSGLGLIAFGALLVLSVYLKLAGPLGRALDSFASVTIGVGRFFLPILCIGLGVALARRKSWQNQIRTSIGWTSLTGVLLGLTHVFFSDAENRTGGWFGYVIGEPTKNSLSDIGATVLLMALLIGSIMLVSGKSAPELIVVLRNAWRKIIGKVSLATENLSGALDENRGFLGEESDLPSGFAPQDDQRPELYDYALDGVDEDEHDESKQPRRERKRRERDGQAAPKPATKPATKLAPVKGEAQQIPLGPSGQPSNWVLPELEFLSLTSNKKANEEAIRKIREKLGCSILNDEFEREFWSGKSLQELFAAAQQNAKLAGPMERIFASGMREYQKLRERRITDSGLLMDGARRAMRASLQREMDAIESNLSMLASVGSVSPYVGLFGTVWGIMHAFTGLAQMQQVTLAKVAPGIAEALVATAIGLFAAIPA
ncbi:MAG: hypothetical protein EBV40_07545, partial [Actinobacteria bacterium]|nr:hypothetical protein [Actinomycetota bacterium]